MGYSQCVECVLLQLPDRLAEETRADQKEQVGHHDEEDGKCGAGGEGVDEETAGKTANDADDGGEGDRCGGFAEGDTANKDDRLETYSDVGELSWHSVGPVRTYLHVAR